MGVAITLFVVAVVEAAAAVVIDLLQTRWENFEFATPTDSLGLPIQRSKSNRNPTWSQQCNVVGSYLLLC